MKILNQGAEAIIYLNENKNQIIKDRIKKSYRLDVIDEKLRKARTKSEAKIMGKLNKIINVPKIFEDETDKNKKITMEYIYGKRLSDFLEKLNWKKICEEIGIIITKIHNQNIIHGDLTTSNMIYKESKKEVDDLIGKRVGNPTFKNSFINNKKITAEKPYEVGFEADNLKAGRSEADKNKFKIYLIDFGLSFHSHKIEDKAVDLHLLKQALEAKHFKIAEDAIKIILDNYKSDNYALILEQLKKVESRGRYKERY